MTRKKKPEDFNPVPDFPKGHQHYGKRRCQAWTPNQGRQCLSLAMKEKKICYTHGGASPKGMGSASWKTGRYSKYVPTGLRERYEAEANDPELLALNDEIALMRSRLSILLEKIESAPDSGSTWKELRKNLRQFEKVQRAASNLEGTEREHKMHEVAQVFDDLRSAINRGVAEWAAWREIITLTDQVRKLTESEQKRRVAGEHILQMHDVMTLFDYTVNLINDIVSNPKERSQLSEGLYRLSRQMDGAKSLAGS